VFGLQLRAIREDERAARAAGLSVLTLKVKAFVISAALASLAGSMYAPFIGYVDPSTFSITLSFLLIAIVIIGGRERLWGDLGRNSPHGHSGHHYLLPIA
jgi:branched-chain amino acid transport system permease protein